MEIAIFGTSADPPTISHQKILVYLANHYDLVSVYASDNPFKSHASGFVHRQKMLDLLVRDLHRDYPHLHHTPEVSDRRSIHTLEKAKQRWGEDNNFTIVIGSDLVDQIFQWYQAEKLLSQVKILVIPRENYPLTQEDIEKINRHSNSGVFTKWHFAIASCHIPPYSSSNYRENHHDSTVIKSIQEYIEKNHLYFS
ncbi:nicotinate-nucleotide adenylyltransferase [Cyanobacterium aponinum UTEX 3222]|uniref:nicotinate-nucleotide adenylyltransferase n=1 Tax=Cyanobacterium aponinum TaxID=379064 RepID=UPI002B4C2097|nr:nicotinate-nucleotide adenylyltransferase [Cyanobacterium aponinum]WRL37980.1 nicotinate-nucleotide adenylyltransferase [Cyanobacterium aponinum UTEX 3221]WRL41540.1 nicotinate-nucleotide adenylyltransferase [Cyanobacterium aponinum UTEX 3222]